MDREVSREVYHEHSIEMRFTGTYHNVGRFMDSLSRLEQIVYVSAITMAEPKSLSAHVVVRGD